jgi:hypothetical protein
MGSEFDSPRFRHKKLEDCYKPIGIFVALLSDSGIPLAWYARYASSILASSTKFLFRILFVTETTYKSKFSWASILVV